MQDDIAIVLIAGIFGSIITWFAKLFYDQNRERFISEQQHKKNLKFIQDINPDIKTKSNIKETLRAEYNKMLLYAPDGVVKSLKVFILSPSDY